MYTAVDRHPVEVKRRRISSPHPSSLATINSKDIIFEILSRLPVNSLIRFTSVCKSWHAIISDLSFVTAHLDRSKNNPKIAIISFGAPSMREVNLYSYELKQGRRYARFLFGKKYPERKSSGIHRPPRSNGLFLLDLRAAQLLVFNPSTRESTTLPKGSLSRLNPTCRAGFGFLPYANVYKVVQYFYRWYSFGTRRCSIGLEVFALGFDSSWRAIVEDPPYPIDTKHTPVSPTSEGMMIYFMIDNRLHSSSPQLIFSFDLKDEKYAVVPPPSPTVHVSSLRYTLLELQGKLCFANTLWGDMYDIWIYEEGNRSSPLKDKYTWTHMYTIDFRRRPERFASQFACRRRRPKNFAFVAEKEGKLLLHIDDGKNWLAYYDPRTESFEPAVNLADGFPYCKDHKTPNFVYCRADKCSCRYFVNWSLFQWVSYVESLVPAVPRRLS